MSFDASNPTDDMNSIKEKEKKFFEIRPFVFILLNKSVFFSIIVVVNHPIKNPLNKTPEVPSFVIFPSINPVKIDKNSKKNGFKNKIFIYLHKKILIKRGIIPLFINLY
ncbi:hypothetical protein OSSY52_06760 [Tepiditoga spiralis]|uniref:Uncharacterized protein n=1 Tax=Tepiditoga spiralis TaxID=2108365 RepID=A0A7G1G3F1_9BACT|nr:hypothetical protein OSSY52_06760 [Tepiditoga spiralis]